MFSQPPTRPPVLHFDLLVYLLPFLASSPATLASFALVSVALREPATRQLYRSVSLADSPRTYQLFFHSHASPISSLSSSSVVSPLTYTKHLYLGRHFLPSSSSNKPGRPSTSLYTASTSRQPSPLQVSDLQLPPLRPDLFPNLQTLHLDVHRSHLASVLPIIIAVNPVELIFSSCGPPSTRPSPSSTHLFPYTYVLPHTPSTSTYLPVETAIAYLPTVAFSSYANLESVLLLSTDLHPPDESDYPPFSRFPFPTDLPSLKKVEWVYTVGQMASPGGLAALFFANLAGILDWEGEVVVTVAMSAAAGAGEMATGITAQAMLHLLQMSLQLVAREGEEELEEMEEVEAKRGQSEKLMRIRGLKVRVRVVKLDGAPRW